MTGFIQVSNLVKEFPIKKGFFNKQAGAVHAVNNFSLEIKKGETLGLVGESGCGKSTAGRCIVGLIPPTRGSIRLEGEEVTTAKAFKKRMQIIFQNPYSSLNPRMSVGDILKEPFIIHRNLSGGARKARIKELLEMTGLNEGVLRRYPHQFSGGQRQRIGIARALALNPEFIVADEPVSALDISIQAQILNLMKGLRKEFNLTYLFISHDLSVIKYICDRVAVMYLGEIVELAGVKDLFESPKHPYTKALLSSIPLPEPDRDLSGRIILKGDIPSPVNPPSGCKFHTRCPYAMEICGNTRPGTAKAGEGHFVSCHLVG